VVSVWEIRRAFDDEHVEEGMSRVIYTVAMDDGGTPYHLWMAMMLLSSIRRSGFDGKLML
jgi:hypothetical protein